jgi:hypothetical protein
MSFSEEESPNGESEKLKIRNCSGAFQLRDFSDEESTDERPLKLKSQQWILHVEGKSLCRWHFEWKGPP